MPKLAWYIALKVTWFPSFPKYLWSYHIRNFATLNFHTSSSITRFKYLSVSARILFRECRGKSGGVVGLRWAFSLCAIGKVDWRNGRLFKTGYTSTTYARNTDDHLEGLCTAQNHPCTCREHATSSGKYLPSSGSPLHNDGGSIYENHSSRLPFFRNRHQSGHCGRRAAYRVRGLFIRQPDVSRIHWQFYGYPIW